MPLEVKTDRCRTHPARPAVDICARCKRPLCLACAVPVRGQVLGPECLTPDLTGGTEVSAASSRLGWGAAAAIAGTAIAAAATVLPWTRFGRGAGPFGAWVISPRWSIVAGSAGLALFLWTIASRRSRGFAAYTVRLVLLVIAAAAGVLAIVSPPPFTKAAIGPWLFLSGVVIAVAGSIGTLLEHPG